MPYIWIPYGFVCVRKGKNKRMCIPTFSQHCETRSFIHLLQKKKNFNVSISGEKTCAIKCNVCISIMFLCRPERRKKTITKLKKKPRNKKKSPAKVVSSQNCLNNYPSLRQLYDFEEKRT